MEITLPKYVPVKHAKKIRFSALNGKEMSGLIVSRRFSGGQIEFTVALDEPVQYRWRDTPSYQMVVRHEQVLEVLARFTEEELFNI